jgi:hypothetical protein
MTDEIQPSPETLGRTAGMVLATIREPAAKWIRLVRKPWSRGDFHGGRWLAETLGLVALVALVQWKWPGMHAKVLGFSLYWIPVALMSGQYGSRAGLFAALAASAASLSLDWPARLAEQDFYRHVASVSAQPLAWLVYALVLGGLRDLHRARDIAARVEIATVRESAEIIADGLERGLTEINRLELRIARDEATLDAVVRALARLRLDRAPEIYVSFAQLARAATAADSVQLFRCDRGGFALAAQVGDIDGADPVAAPPATLADVAANRKAMTYACGAQNACAAPICRGAQAAVQGVIVASLAATGEDLVRAMRRVERLGQLLGNLIEASGRRLK